jgi:hypothetical protein
MSTARVLHTCDQCGQDKSLELTAANKYPSLAPAHWISLKVRKGSAVNADVCSWECVKAFAEAQAASAVSGTPDTKEDEL